MNYGFVNLGNAREERQKEIMQELQSEGKCPFCMENLFLFHTEPVLNAGPFWIVTRNMFPYKHTLHHFLLIARHHLESVNDFPDQMVLEAHQHRKWLIGEFQLTGGAFCQRFGDTNLSAGTLTHPHEHLIVPDLHSPGYAPVRFKIGTDLENI